MTWVYNDGGRAKAGFKGEAGDCTCRAIAIATGKPYRVIYNDLNVLARTATKLKVPIEDGASGRHGSARTGVSRAIYSAYIKGLGGVWTPTMSVGSGTRVHLLAAELPDGSIICRLSRHLVAVINGVVYDTYDPTRGGTRCVYGYWEFPRGVRR